MGTLHCMLENGADLYVNERRKKRHYHATGLLKKEGGERRMPNCDFFTSRGAYLARDIPVFVMYCVNGASLSSLLVDYDIYIYIHVYLFIYLF